ncbi:MAG TPA: NmrA family NAD(P)-binding protein [Chloroflexota bacterium]|nr:NmrA family NAD(P)-binding protein [Chloroflexota bacterium]
MILVSGAAGKTGRAVVAALAALGAPVRALVRRAPQAEAVRAAGAQEWLTGDMLDSRTWAAACDGVRAVYHICPNMHPEEGAIGAAVLHAARVAGCAHLVYHSVLHPQTQAMPHHWHKLQVEELLFESGLPYTILQPAPYMQNVLVSWPAIVAEGRYSIPYAASTLLGMVDLADVAEAAARILTEPGHVGATYELGGPDILDQNQVAVVLSQRLGRTVVTDVQSLADWERRARAAGLGSYQLVSLLKMFRYYERHGLWGNPRVLGWLLGRPPTTFAEFVGRVR